MSVGADLLRFSDRPVLLWDCESFRINTLDDNAPFEIAWIVIDRWGKVLESQQYYLKWPDYRMSPDAARITRFNPAWVANGHDPEFVLQAFESYLLDPRYIVAGHAILSFDSNLHQLWRRVLGRKPDFSYLPRIIDTNLLSRAYKEGWKPDRSNLLAWQYKVAAGFRKGVKTNLTLMAKELGVVIDEAKTHGAAYDLEVNAGVYRKLVNLVEI